MRVCESESVLECVCACVRACVRACECVCLVACLHYEDVAKMLGLPLADTIVVMDNNGPIGRHSRTLLTHSLQADTTCNIISPASLIEM